jgi:predicted metalloprotease with PDZ domain
MPVRLSRPRPAAAVRLAGALLILLGPGPLLAHATTPADAQAPVLYAVVADPGSSRFHVSVTLDGVAPGVHDFCIPAWTPGYYQILSFEHDILHVGAAGANGLPLIVTHPSPRTWRVVTLTSAAEPVTLHYDVRAEDAQFGFFGSELRATDRTGYINGASALMYVPGRLAAPARLTVTVPADWKIACPLGPEGWESNAPAPRRTCRFVAANYDELIDSPIQLGSFDELHFESGGVTCRCVLVGKSGADKSRLSALLAKLLAAESRLFYAPGRPAPFAHYLFIYHIGGAGFQGGLEHRNSTVIHLNEPIGSANSDSFVTVTAHELFHAWNVKHFRPSGLGPFDYSGPVRSPSIWFAEGVTDYYSSLLTLRTGLRNRAWFLGDMAGRIFELDETPSRKYVSLEEASLKAWEGESEGYAGLSYYTKGSLVGFYFDLRIRAVTGGKRGLDDVLRALDAQYGDNVGYPPEAILRALNAISGADLSAEYARYVQGTDEIDWSTALQPLGMHLSRHLVSYLGVRVDPAGERTVVTGIEPGSAADRMGLRIGDKIVDVDDVLVNASEFSRSIGSRQPNSPMRMHVLRNGALIRLDGESGRRYADEKIEILPGADARTRRLRDDFLQPGSSARATDSAPITEQSAFCDFCVSVRPINRRHSP